VNSKPNSTGNTCVIRARAFPEYLKTWIPEYLSTSNNQDHVHIVGLRTVRVGATR
jgi:hypothetical protein